MYEATASHPLTVVTRIIAS